MDELEILKEEISKMKEDHEIELLMTKSGVKSLKAAMAIFDRDSLSKNEEGEYEDLAGAVESFKEENGWLFEKPVSVMSTGISHGRGSGKISSVMTDEEYYTALMEKKGRTR